MKNLKKFQDFKGSWEEYKWYLYENDALSANLIGSLKPEFKPDHLKNQQTSLLDDNTSVL